jgi:hypothetical protein
MTNKIITKDEIIAAINSSGYLIEQRIEQILARQGYFIQTSDAYLDDETDKSREVDLTAQKVFKVMGDQEHRVSTNLIIECENNQQPVVFFKNSQSSVFDYNEIKYSGTPSNVFVDRKTVPIDEYLGFSDFHHYKHAYNYTQYCSFQQKKDNTKWLALHLDTQHDSFTNLIKSTEFKRRTYYNNYVKPLEGRENFINLHFFYPILVLQGGIIEAYQGKDELILNDIPFLLFRKQIIKNQDPASYKIAVVTEGFLPQYLKFLDKEMASIIERIISCYVPIKMSMSEKTQKAEEMKNYRETFGIPFEGEDIN